MDKYVNGIDVSSHQGKIDWNKVKGNISFAMIRAGYGQNHIDTTFEYNSSECERLNIPYGVYWFSYAKNINDAINEALFCIKTIANKNISYPVVFDFEYDSEKNTTLIKNDRCNIARTFMEIVENSGYYAMLYSNPDYLVNKGFFSLTDRFDLWLAHWTSKDEPYQKSGIWQWTDKGKIDGINGNVDLDRASKDYPSLLHKKDIKKELIIKLRQIYDEIGNMLKECE